MNYFLWPYRSKVYLSFNLRIECTFCFSLKYIEFLLYFFLTLLIFFYIPYRNSIISSPFKEFVISFSYLICPFLTTETVLHLKTYCLLCHHYDFLFDIRFCHIHIVCVVLFLLIGFIRFCFFQIQSFFLSVFVGHLFSRVLVKWLFIDSTMSWSGHHYSF